MTTLVNKKYERQNILVLLLQVISWAGCISLVNSQIHWGFKLIVLIFFALMMQGVFSFMHECFHGLANSNKKVNWFMGWLSSAIFGSSNTLIRVSHTGHHSRNRTPHEIVEYYFEDESRIKKTFNYYFGILGGIWILSFLGYIILPFTPYRFAKVFRQLDHENNTYYKTFEAFTKRDWNMMRVELFLGLLFTGAIYYFLDWRWQTLLLCYGFFAFTWSSLQWVYHVRTPIHITEGAYNLRVPAPVRWLFLNFNHNLTHHRHPNIPWQELYKKTDQKETQPLIYRYIRMFLPPEPFPEDGSVNDKIYF